MKTNIGIPEHDIDVVVTFLNALLADEYLLYTKTRNAHWNIKGENFYGLHTFFETQYEALDVIIDDIAERIRALGHFAIGSLKEFMSATHKEGESQENSNSKKVLQTLVGDHETIIRDIRKKITPISDKYKDYGTADFVTDVMEKHEKMAWMLRSYLT